MDNSKITAALGELALLLDKCADDVPYELSAKNNLYFRMVDLSKEAKDLMKEMRES